MRNLYAQKANRKLFGVLPVHYLVWFYYTGKKKYDPEKFVNKKERIEERLDKKIQATGENRPRRVNNLEFKKLKRVQRLDSKIENGNMFMQWGEQLSVLDSANLNLTVERFRGYLSAKGYFLNKAHYSIREFRSRGNVTYTIQPGKAYFIDTVFYDIHDTAVYNLVLANKEKSLIKRGERYDQDNFTKERERIDLMMKDYGYYEFSRQYVEFDVDTSFRHNKKVAVEIVIQDPARRETHKQFTITGVNFVTDAATTIPGQPRSSRDYHGIHFSFHKDNYNLRILSQRVFLQPGELYSRSNTFNTQRQLANLDAFKFVNVNYDTAGGEFIANIYTSPLDRYQWSNETGVNVTQGFPGPFYNMTIKKRNVFRGLESFDLSARFGFEGVASATRGQNIYRSTEAGANIGMTFPQIIFPMSEDAKFKLGRYNPKTKLLVGYSYTDRPEYRRNFATLSGTYSMENRQRTQYSFTFANINIIDTVNTSKDFRDFLAQQDSIGNFALVNSFYPSFVNSMILAITWNQNNYGQSDRNSVFIRATFESGGTIWNFFEPRFITNNDLQYFKYLRLGLDIRSNRVIDKNTVVAYRFNGGVAYPYGSNNSVPYEKFFFAGGSNSIRAWRPRRLGPGSFKPDLSARPESDGLFNYNIEKPANVLLEASIELRKNLFGFVDGAVFVDAGNVWSFQQWVKRRNEEVVPNGNSQFKWDEFYKEIAIGTGFGIRFDFTFLILRFDVGIKAYDPARDPGDRWVLQKMKFFRPFGVNKEPVIYNVGIGYPF